MVRCDIIDGSKLKTTADGRVLTGHGLFSLSVKSFLAAVRREGAMVPSADKMVQSDMLCLIG